MDSATLMTLLLTQQRGGSDPQALLNMLAERNPEAASMLQALCASRPPAAEPREPIDIKPEETTIETVRDPECTRLQEELAAANLELQRLRERSDCLADALGACALCWGEEPACRACRGHGRPGRSIPNAALFAEYVVPAVRLVRSQFTRPTAASNARVADAADTSDASVPLRHCQHP